MKKSIGALIVLCLVVVVGLKMRQHVSFKQAGEVVEIDLIQDDYYSEYEKMSLAFLEENYLLSEGVLVSDKTSHTIVSSEQLLYLNYLLQTDAQDMFRQGMHYIETELLSAEGVVAIGKEENLIEQFSTYDQMQLFKVLYRAYTAWGEEQYMQMSISLEENIYNEYVEEGRVYPYYRTAYNQEMNEWMPLYFLDLNAIGLMGNFREAWEPVFTQAVNLIEGAYIGGVFPFYHTSYHYGNEIYNEEHKGNMEETISVVLNMAQVGKHKEDTIGWLKDNLKKGPIYIEYDKLQGIPTDHKESAVVYGLLAQLGKSIGDIELYTLAIEKMLILQIKNSSYQLNGAFVDTQTGDIEVYDNLIALLGF